MKVGDTVYLVKYALSEGIIQDTVNYVSPAGNYVGLSRRRYQAYKIGAAVFANRDDAVKQALKMRDKKVAIIKKQIAKLEALTFEESA